MNHLSGVDRLANRFSIMRHAQSRANAGGIIVSRIENDRQGNYGLTGHGRQQAQHVGRELLDDAVAHVEQPQRLLA